MRNKCKNNSINQNKELNIGIRILRIFLSFMVVIDHFYNSKLVKHYSYIIYYHIPCFFLISFFFTYRTFISFNINKIKIRFERLLIPYFCWSLIAWIKRNLYYYIMRREFIYSIKDFYISLINGHILNVVLWFQNILILVTLLFLIIIFLFKKKYLFIFELLYLLSYILQYSGINYFFFLKNFSTHSRSTFGRFFEAIPLAITGFLLASHNIMEINKRNKKSVFFHSLIILIIITKYQVFSEINNFKYGGLRLNLAAFCIFMIFSLIPSKIYRFDLKNNIIIKITNYTGGIYFTHYLIGNGFICSSIIFVKKKTIIGCLIIYLMSYIVSCIGFKLLGNTKLKHLFA